MRALVGLALLALTACGTTVQSITSAGDYVPWLPLPPAHQMRDPAQPAKPAPVPSGAPECVAGQLEGIGFQGGAAAGNSNLALLFRNKGSSGCFMRGFVDVTIMDRRGRVLARAAGDVGRGTFFADPPVSDVWMPAGTPALPKPFTTRDGFPGQAFVNMSWYDCREPLASEIEIGVRDGGGTFRMPYVMKSSTNPTCQGGTPVGPGVRRGPVSPAGLSPSAEVDVKLSAPLDAKRGSQITYFATVTNTGYRPFDLQPCADYWESIHGKQFMASYQLNCAPAARLGPGWSVTFEMRYTIAGETTPGASELCWYLADARLTGGAGSCAPLTIS